MLQSIYSDVAHLINSLQKTRKILTSLLREGENIITGRTNVGFKQGVIGIEFS